MLAAIGKYVVKHSIPPLDRGLRSIVAGQVRNLLVGGWPVAEIKAQALELVSKYDRFNGHKAMTQLQRILEVADEDLAFEKHKAQRVLDAIPPSAAALKAMGFSTRERRPSPRGHDFLKGPEFDTCIVCSAPLGVHVKFAVSE